MISVILNYVGQNRKGPWDGRWITAMGNRCPNGRDPALINLKMTYFEWRKIKIKISKEVDDDGSPMATHWEENQDKFFNRAADDLDNAELWVPKFTLLPAEIATKAILLRMKPWDVYEQQQGVEIKRY